MLSTGTSAGTKCSISRMQISGLVCPDGIKEGDDKQLTGAKHEVK